MDSNSKKSLPRYSSTILTILSFNSGFLMTTNSQGWVFSADGARDAVARISSRISCGTGREVKVAVAGESAGSKLAKAEKLGVTVLDFDAFREKLESLGGDLEGAAGDG